MAIETILNQRKNRDLCNKFYLMFKTNKKQQ